MKFVVRTAMTSKGREVSPPQLLAKILLVAALCNLACSQAQADGEVKNGDFGETWRMRDNPDEQLIPKYWFASEPETTGNPWVKVLSESPGAVEIKAGESSRFLYQDVRIDGTRQWTLKWKCKGEGGASVIVFPRDDNNTIYPSTSKSCQFGDGLEEYEMTISMPPESTVLRIMLAPRQPDSTAIFAEVELNSTSN